MASLRVTIGQVTGQLNFDDAKGAEIINAYIAEYDGPVDAGNQEKLTWFITHLAGQVHDTYLSRLRRLSREQALLTAEESAKDWN